MWTFLGRMLKSVLIVVCVWFGGFLWYSLALPDAKPEDVPTVDGIVVLTGGPGRLQAALGLLAQSKGQRLLISGVNIDVSDQLLRDALVAGRSQVVGKNRAKIPTTEDTIITPELYDCCVDTGRSALDTVGNAREIATWARQNNYSKILVVTAAHHMSRSVIEIGRQAPELDLTPHPVFSPNMILDERWTHNRTMRILFSEYNKLIVSKIRAQLIGPTGGGEGK